MMGDMIWKKLSREGGFIMPESMLDVRDYCTSHELHPSPEMDLAKMKKIVAGRFRRADRHLGERRAGAGRGGGNLRPGDQVRRFFGPAASEGDLRSQGADQLGERNSAPVRQAHVRRPVRARAGGRRGPDPVAEENWKKNPNLVAGDFEHGSRRRAQGLGQGRPASSASRLAGWSAGWPKKAIPQQGHPLHARQDVAENEGVMYYSDYFPWSKGRKYRFQCRWRVERPGREGLHQVLR